MSEDAESKSHAGRWIIAVVAALVLYVLSCGPVTVCFIDSGPSDKPPRWLTTLYAPVFMIGGTPLFKGPLKAYLDWWEKILNKD